MKAQKGREREEEELSDGSASSHSSRVEEEERDEDREEDRDEGDEEDAVILPCKMSNKELGIRLILAAEEGDLEEVKYLVEEKKADINFVINDEDPLIAAVDNDHIEIVRYLVHNGADLSDYNLAWAMGHEEILDYLLEQEGILLEYVQGGETVLWRACRSGDMPLVKKLLARGAEIDDEYEDELKPLLLIAIKKNNLELVKLLLERGADPNQEYSGKSPLYAACDTFRFDIAKMLVENGARAINERRTKNAIVPLIKSDHEGEAQQLIRTILCHDHSCLIAEQEDELAELCTPLGIAAYYLDDQVVWMFKLSGGERAKNEHCKEDIFSAFAGVQFPSIEQRRLSIQAAFRIKQWSPEDHKWYPKEIKDAITSFCLVAKKLKLFPLKSILHHIISFIPFGWYTYRHSQEVSELYKQGQKRARDTTQKTKHKKRARKESDDWLGYPDYD